jgi:DNA replication protein DnaC
MRDKINSSLKDLKMTSAADNLDSCLQKYKDRESFLLGILEIELRERKNRSIKRKITMADFPIDREWSMINSERNPQIDFGSVKILSNGNFLKEKNNICFIGAPGLGKTHSMVSVGKDLCRKGFNVKSFNTNDLVTKLEEAKIKGELSKLMEKLLKPDLLFLDELGFVPFSDNGARLLFDVFSRRYENGSIAVTTNLAFNKWSSIFGGIELTTALVDRFTHKCEIFVYKGNSVRLTESQEKNKIKKEKEKEKEKGTDETGKLQSDK